MIPDQTWVNGGLFEYKTRAEAITLRENAGSDRLSKNLSKTNTKDLSYLRVSPIAPG